MLGRKTYTAEEIAGARRAVDQQLAAYRRLATAAADDPDVNDALDGFESLYFNNMLIVLDRYFIHRIRPVTGKDSNPLNEVELFSDSLMNNNGVLRTGTVVKYVQAQTIVKQAVGEEIRLTEATFDSLATAFLAEVERRFS